MSVKVPLSVGDKQTFTKTIAESDVYQFAGITGDFSPFHVNEEYMKGTQYGTRIAHGVLTFALSSTASTLIHQPYDDECPVASRMNDAPCKLHRSLQKGRRVHGFNA